MRVAAAGLGILLVLAGIVWLLQGLNVLPGSFMTGQPFWALVGVVCLVLGSGLLYWGLRGAGRRGGGVRKRADMQ
ncbi:MAG: hypothetical protein M3437_05470 [Chloroflexota bacterium]|nr:hypothetical protein [Chloroflexota bacterium]MDQ5865533.1 hypothetical protein [Chloroflexota bacterium]